jgi:hypothetical protein
MRPVVPLFGGPATANHQSPCHRSDPRRYENDPAAFNGIFMIALTPGLVAHVIEEQTREKPMRRIDLSITAMTDHPPEIYEIHCR